MVCIPASENDNLGKFKIDDDDDDNDDDNDGRIFQINDEVLYDAVTCGQF